MKMKKVLALALSASMVVGMLAGCGGSSENKAETTADGKIGRAHV